MVKNDLKAYVVNLLERTDRMEEFKKNKFPFEVERFDAIKTDPGWVGCTASQLLIMSRQKKYPFAIFEDDCELLQSWDVVEKALRVMEEGFKKKQETPYTDKLVEWTKVKGLQSPDSELIVRK